MRNDSGPPRWLSSGSPFCRGLLLLALLLSFLSLAGCKKKGKDKPDAQVPSNGQMQQEMAGGPGGMQGEPGMMPGDGAMQGEPGMMGGMQGEPGMAPGPGGMPGEPGMMGGMQGEPGMMPGPGGMPGEPGMMGGMPGEPGMPGDMQGRPIHGTYVARGPWGYLLVSLKQDGTIDAGLIKGQYELMPDGTVSLNLEKPMQGRIRHTPDGFLVNASFQDRPIPIHFIRVAPFQNLQQLDGNWMLDTTVAFGPNRAPVRKSGQKQPGVIRNGMVQWGISPGSAKPFAVAPTGNTGRFALPAANGSSEQRFAIYLGGNVMVLRRLKNEQGTTVYHVFVKRME